MTARKSYRAAFSSSNLEFIVGSFIPNGASTIATKYGVGFSVAWLSTGAWTVTLDDVFADFVSITVTGQFATSNADAHQFLVGDISRTSTTRSFVIKHVTAADVSTTDLAAADISTSGTANKINFICAVATADVPGAGV